MTLILINVYLKSKIIFIVLVINPTKIQCVQTILVRRFPRICQGIPRIIKCFIRAQPPRWPLRIFRWQIHRIFVSTVESVRVSQFDFVTAVLAQWTRHGKFDMRLLFLLNRRELVERFLLTQGRQVGRWVQWDFLHILGVAILLRFCEYHFVLFDWISEFGVQLIDFIPKSTLLVSRFFPNLTQNQAGPRDITLINLGKVHSLIVQLLGSLVLQLVHFGQKIVQPGPLVIDFLRDHYLGHFDLFEL